MRIQDQTTKYFIGTSFAKIGTEEFPYFYDTLPEALRSANRIAELGYDATVRLIQTFSFEETLVKITKVELPAARVVRG